ncbi:hypothetical protein PG994_002906 [Apiospora phragmitis]|uniref:Uncharacterized protein n=1 Tax=Apiospora phragmitis TaxID=2905665 RepID=A0ABR1WAA5_9PEZI
MDLHTIGYIYQTALLGLRISSFNCALIRWFEELASGAVNAVWGIKSSSSPGKRTMAFGVRGSKGGKAGESFGVTADLTDDP